jgi:hypothetical protein
MTTNESNARERADEALRLFRAGDFEGAVKAFTETIALDPDSAVAYHNRGLAYQRLGKEEEAKADITKGASLRRAMAPEFPAERAREELPFHVRSCRIWIPFFRFCHVSEDKVVVTPPIVFGRGYVFDWQRRTVSVSRHFLGIPVSKIDIPLRKVRSLRVTETQRESSMLVSGAGMVSGGSTTVHKVLMEIAGHSEGFEVASLVDSSVRARRILRAIQDVTVIRHMRMQIRETALEKPGISHTALLRSVEVSRDLKETAIRRLVEQGDLRCEQTGRVRRYFAQTVDAERSEHAGE